MASPARKTTFTGTDGTVWTTASTAVLEDQTGAAKAWTVNTWNGTFAASPAPTIVANRGRITVTAPASGSMPIRRALADPGAFAVNELRVKVQFYLQSFGDDRCGVILRQLTNATTNSYLYVEFGGYGVGKNMFSAMRIGNYWAGSQTVNVQDGNFDLSALPASTVANNYDILCYDLPVGTDGSYSTVIQVRYWQGTGSPDVDCPAVGWARSSGSGYASVKGTTTSAATWMQDLGAGFFGNTNGRTGLYVQPNATDNVVDVRFDNYTATAENVLALPFGYGRTRSRAAAVGSQTRTAHARTAQRTGAAYTLEHPVAAHTPGAATSGAAYTLEHPVAARTELAHTASGITGAQRTLATATALSTSSAAASTSAIALQGSSGLLGITSAVGAPPNRWLAGSTHTAVAGSITAVRAGPIGAAATAAALTGRMSATHDVPVRASAVTCQGSSASHYVVQHVAACTRSQLRSAVPMQPVAHVMQARTRTLLAISAVTGTPRVVDWVANGLVPGWQARAALSRWHTQPVQAGWRAGSPTV